VEDDFDMLKEMDFFIRSLILIDIKPIMGKLFQTQIYNKMKLKGME